MADVRLTATNPEDSSVVPVACDASGRLLLQELPAIETIDGDLTVTGKGSFAGGKSIIGNDGSAQFAQGAVDIYANGTVEFTQNVNFSSANFAGIVEGSRFINTTDSADPWLKGQDAGGNETFYLKKDGSASFKGLVQCMSEGNNYIPTLNGQNGASLDQIYLDAPGGRVFSVKGDGSANFAGDIFSDGSASFADKATFLGDVSTDLGSRIADSGYQYRNDAGEGNS